MSIRTIAARFVCASVFCLAASTLTAQNEPLTHVAIYKLKPGAEALWTEMGNKHLAPLMNKLMAEGTVLGYGVETDLHHMAGEPNADIWYTVPNHAAYQKTIEEIQKMLAGGGSAFQQLRDGMDMDKHQDYLLRPIAANGKSVAVGTMPFTEVSVAKVKPGMGDEYRKGFESYVKPIYDRLVDDGTILGYGLYQEAFHSQDPGMRWMVVTAPNLAAWDKMAAAFAEDRKKRSPEDRAAMQKQYLEITSPEAHRDYLSRASVFATK